MRPSPPSQTPWPEPKPSCPSCWSTSRPIGQAELDSRQCLSGPHKDDLAVEIDGNPAKTYGSQGQTRTAALSLKLAQREIFFQETGEWPVLLLDDVLSELDHRAAGLRPQPHPGRAGVYFLL